MKVPEQLASGGGVEERAERQAEAGVNGGDLPQCSLVELRPGLVAVQPLEQAHVVAVERRTWREEPGHRQVRIESRDVDDRGLLQLEHGLVLAAIRDLEDSAEEERLVALTAEHGCASADAEQLRRDPRGVLGREPGRCGLEDRVHGSRCYSAGVQNPSSERIGSPFRGRIVAR